MASLSVTPEDPSEQNTLFTMPHDGKNYHPPEVVGADWTASAIRACADWENTPGPKTPGVIPPSRIGEESNGYSLNENISSTPEQQ